MNFSTLDAKVSVKMGMAPTANYLANAAKMESAIQQVAHAFVDLGGRWVITNIFQNFRLYDSFLRDLCVRNNAPKAHTAQIVRESARAKTEPAATEWRAIAVAHPAFLVVNAKSHATLDSSAPTALVDALAKTMPPVLRRRERANAAEVLVVASARREVSFEFLLSLTF